MSKSMMSAAGGGKVTVSGLEAGKILQGTTVTVKQGSKTVAKVAGSIPSKAAATYTPKTTNQTIAAGQYLAEAQIIKGDANLVAANILKGKSIFGIAGGLDILAAFSHTGGNGLGAAGYIAVWTGSGYSAGANKGRSGSFSGTPKAVYFVSSTSMTVCGITNTNTNGLALVPTPNNSFTLGDDCIGLVLGVK